MIKTEAIENLSGSIKIPLANIVTYDEVLGQLKTTNKTIIINGAGGGTDTTPPSTPIAAIINYVDDTGSTTSTTSTASSTDDNRPDFRIGSLPSDATEAVLYVDGIAAASTYNVSTGLLSPTGVILDGVHTISFAYKDAAGNLSGKSPVFNLTITAPSTPSKVRTVDTQISVLPAAIDAAQNNVYLLTQDSGQPNWSEVQFKINQNDFSLASGSVGTAMVTKIKFNIRSAGYQMVKILLYDKNNNIITFKRTDSNTVERTTDSTIKIDVTSNGFMLVDNATYELANIFNTDKLPVALAAGWYSVTSNTDATASFEALFTTPVEVSKIRVYRCGASSVSFNGGSDPYDIVITDNSAKTYSLAVPKATAAEFSTITAFKELSLDSTGGVVDISTKVHPFVFEFSTDGINYETPTAVQTSSQNATTGLYTVLNTYPNKLVDTNKLYVKVPDADIPFLKNIIVDCWYLV